MSVVVGVSPTSGSPAALRWAAREAQLRGVRLRAVQAWRSPRMPGSPGVRPPLSVVTGEDQVADAELALREHVVDALGSADGVECVVVHGGAANALLTASAGAELLVLGEVGSGALGGVRTGFIAPQVVLKANCPVVVMPSSVGAELEEEEL
ncbi:universal stress protein [Jatrophihabitans sp.]|uniref:universal stress protein n=1 Tax=Jatrophihabitans sp. TaxID=1932789 RepID=UPI0030C6EDE6|nr:putative universal stress protein family [Jatrophihabitans sp.]